jgi:uncharacterized protein YdhG (YjbR/CyaY superfamily)
LGLGGSLVMEPTMSMDNREGIDGYLAAVAETHRAALENLRSQIKGFYPEATEHLSYGHPLFKLNGHPLVGFSAHKRHSAFFVWSSTALNSLGDMLDGYDTAESTIRFAPERPIPEDVVRAVLDVRAKEINDRWPQKSRR